jgi:predicted heme/steroid binding protein
MSENSLAPDSAAGWAGGGMPSPGLARYTPQELARHDGSDPDLPVLVAYEGRVYDVTGSYPWARGRHWGDHRAGRDLTARMDPRIHGTEMLARVPCIGILQD